MVELAMVLPILLILFMGVVEFGRIFHSYLIITNASREGARVAVLGRADTDISDRVSVTTAGLDSAQLQTNITPETDERVSGSLATVEVSYSISLIFPLFDSFVPNPLTMVSRTTMRIE